MRRQMLRLGCQNESEQTAETRRDATETSAGGRRARTWEETPLQTSRWELPASFIKKPEAWGQQAPLITDTSDTVWKVPGEEKPSWMFQTMETTATQQTFCFFSWSQIHHLIFSGNICYSVIETEITCDLETTTQLIMYNNMFAAGRAPCLFTFLLRFPGDTFKHQHYELWVILLVFKVQLRDWSLVHLNSLSGWNNNSEDLRTFWFHVMDDSKHRDDGQKVWSNKESSRQLSFHFLLLRSTWCSNTLSDLKTQTRLITQLWNCIWGDPERSMRPGSMSGLNPEGHLQHWRFKGLINNRICVFIQFIFS